MATTDNAVKYGIRVFKEIQKYIPEISNNNIATWRWQVSQGIIQMDRLLEMAMSNVGGFAMVSISGMDFCDWSDAKGVVSSDRIMIKKQGVWRNSFLVDNVKSKKGALRIMAYNKKLDKFHYFYIPRHAYEHINSKLEIVIETYTSENEPQWTGIPNRNYKFWEYECASFEEMCNMSEDSYLRKVA